MSQSRQLAAIMFADIVGYTVMMQKDEPAALEKINRFRQVIESITSEHNGKIIQFYGDGCLLLFNSAVDAVNHAKFLQEKFRIEPVVPVRIGIHLGDVLLKEENVFGDGVNVASRIQSLGQANSILFSAEVQDKIKNNPGFQTVSLGTFEFKNVSTPMEIFALTNEGLFVPQRKNMEGKLKKKNFQKRNVIAVLSFILLVVSAFLIYKKIFYKNDTSAIDKSIAVLPFVDMSAAKDQEYFSDGLSEELLNLLAKIPELKVIGRTSSFSFKGKNEDLRSIAEKLGVAHILEGSVRKDGNKIRVTVQLIRATDGSHLWSDTYDRDLDSLFKLQDEIAGAVVKQLKLKLLTVPSSATNSSNIEVHNLILQGNYFFDKLDKENVAKSVDFYNQALAIDSTNARAWTSITNAISRQAWQNYIDQNTGYEKARQAILKAIALDPNYAPAYRELGDIKLYHDFDWKGAEAAYKMAHDLEPSDADVITGLGDHQNVLGQCREAEQFYKKAIVFNPLKPIIYLDLGNALSCDGRFAEAIKYFTKILEINPQYQRAHLYIGRNYLLMGKPEQALGEMEKENLEIFKTFGLALAYHALGRKKEADEKLKGFIENYRDNWSYLIAQLYAFRGEKEEAFTWLGTAYNKKDSWLFWIKSDPLLKKLRPDPRYKALLKKMNLPID